MCAQFASLIPLNHRVRSLLIRRIVLILIIHIVDVPVFVILIESDKMSVQEFPSNSTMMDLLERAGKGISKWTLYRFSIKEDLQPRLNNKPVNDPTCKLQMGDVVELTPAISDKSLIEYREEIERMYERRHESIKQVACRNHLFLISAKIPLF